MGTYDVGIPLSQRAVFPSICVACEKVDPNSKLDISILGADTGSFAENVTEFALGTPVGSAASSNSSTRFEGIPVCSGCESRLKWYHRLFKFATYTIWLPALLLMLVMPGPIWIRVVIFVGIIISPPILTMMYPPAFGATVLNGKANFEFRSKTVYEKFIELNVEEQMPAAEVSAE